MARLLPLTKEQVELVEKNIPLIRSVMRSKIITNERKVGLETDDLYQEGCLLLCRAAQKYDETKKASFRRFAYTVMTNGLISYCKKVNQKQRNQDLAAEKIKRVFTEIYSGTGPEEYAIRQDLILFLQAMKPGYSQTVKSGIDILILKTKGYSGTEIARMFGVKPNLVGARQSRALKELWGNPVFQKFIAHYLL